ncbi:MAG: PorT family protein, partial [Bacteroidetes bacterium]|nr:PorT family protein [Bacteroidota bacterium]
MKKALIILTLFISSSVIGQSSQSIQIKRVQIGIVYSPDYCYRILNYHTSISRGQDIRNKEEMGVYGYTTGLGIKIKIKNKLGIETGILYSIKGEQTKNANLAWVNLSPDFPTKSQTQWRFKYLDIPVKVNYSFIKRKVNCFISAGISANVFLQREAKVISKFADGHKTSESSTIDLGYLKFNLAGIVGFGIKYDFTKNVSISAEPVYRQFINSIVADRNAKEYPNSIGINVGL